MIKFVPDIKPYRTIILFKFLEPWRVVFETDQVWSRFGSSGNFKFGWTHLSAPIFSLWRARCNALLSSLLSAALRLLPGAKAVESPRHFRVHAHLSAETKASRPHHQSFFLF
jgi:hypothetical protein